jgi:hypothetical protein
MPATGPILHLLASQHAPTRYIVVFANTFRFPSAKPGTLQPRDVGIYRCGVQSTIRNLTSCRMGERPKVNYKRMSLAEFGDKLIPLRPVRLQRPIIIYTRLTYIYTVPDTKTSPA